MQQQLDYNEIHELWIISQQQDSREKMKTLHKLYHHIYHPFQKRQLNLENSPACIQIINNIKSD